MIAVLVAAVGAPPAAIAQVLRPAEPVDGRVPLLFSARRLTGKTLRLFRSSPEFEATGLAPLLVRYHRAPTQAERATYARFGFTEGRALASGAVQVKASEAAFRAMSDDGVLAYTSVDLPPPIVLHPMDLARKEIGVFAGAPTFLAQNGAPLTGKGVVVGDLDTEVDVFHPALFRTLGPVAWVDVDGDGELTPGVDGVDLDGNGVIDPAEVVHLLNGTATSLFAGLNATGRVTAIDGTGNPGFDPGWDYVYLDTNGDGRRNVGGDFAGAATAPAMSEPIFVADDVNRDGKLTVPERLIRLGDSKVRAVRSGDSVFTRGDNLSAYVPVAGGADPSHATAMDGAIVGGQPGSSRFLGVAPDAELVVAASQDRTSETAAVQWLADQGAHIILTEIGNFGIDPSDGSTELEMLMDTLAAQGIVFISPAGNLGHSNKHALATIPPAGAPAPYQNEIVFAPVSTEVFFSVTWREGAIKVGGRLEWPDGDAIDLGVDNENGLTTRQRQFVVAHGVTLKGAGYLTVALLAPATAPFPAVGMTLSLQTTSDAPATASLFMIDEAGGWNAGALFRKADEPGSICSPALASKTVAVSAYALHVGPEWSAFPESAGQLRQFSGIGPDLWGDPAVDIAAPDNPVAAAADVYDNGETSGKTVAWMESGGTSGAGSITAGLAALLKQANPTLSGDALRARLLDAARTDAQVQLGTPAEWGAGKLGLGIAAAAGAPPKVTIEAPAQAVPGQMIKLTAVVTDDGDPSKLTSRWDFGYDGTWDAGGAGLFVETTMPADAVAFDVKVEVTDADGWTAAAVARIEVGAPPAGGCGCQVPPGELIGSGMLLALVPLAAARRRRSARAR